MAELGHVDRLVGEVALGEVVVGDDDALDERVVHGVLLGGHVGGDGTLVAARRAVGVGLGRVGEQVDDATELGLRADGQLERRDAGAEAVLQLFERLLERRALTIELVDEHDARERELVGHAPRDLGLHLDALDR